LLLGEEEAGYLGINTERLKMRVILLNTFIVAIATSLVGVISFMAWLCPPAAHAEKQRQPLPAYRIGPAGAILLNIADMVARVLVARASSLSAYHRLCRRTGIPVYAYQQQPQQQKGGFLLSVENIVYRIGPNKFSMDQHGV